MNRFIIKKRTSKGYQDNGNGFMSLNWKPWKTIDSREDFDDAIIRVPVNTPLTQYALFYKGRKVTSKIEALNIN